MGSENGKHLNMSDNGVRDVINGSKSNYIGIYQLQF